MPIMTALRRHLIVLVSFAALAGIAWVIAWYAHARILSLRDARAAQVEAARQDEQARSSAALLHSAVEESTRAREQLDAVASADVVSVASSIESTGSAAGARVRVTGVAPVPDADAARAKKTGVHTVGYTIEGTGTFSQLMEVLQRLETLPAPSVLEQVTLARASEGALWRLSVRLRVLTSVSAS